MVIKDCLYDIGLKRKLNEDSYKYSQKQNFALISDGMGGHEKGDIASGIIVDTFESYLNDFSNENIEDEKDFELSLKNYLKLANEESFSLIIKYANENNINKIMGATIIGIYHSIKFNKIWTFHLGDSRAYRIRDKKIEQLTNDHCMIQNNKEVLSKAIGNFDIFDLDINTYDTKINDILMICSDGVYNYIQEEEINHILEHNFNNHCALIKEKIYSNGAKDNFTLIVMEIL